MQKTRGSRILLLLAINLFLLIKSAFAQYGYFSGFRPFPFFSGGFYYSPLSFYSTFPFWIDFIIIVSILVLVGRAVGKNIGSLGDHGIQVGGIVGFALGLYLSMFLNNIGYSLLTLGPWLIAFVVFAILLGLYKWLKGDGQGANIGFFVAILLGLLAMLLVFPNLFGFIAPDMFSTLITIILIVAAIAFLFFLIPTMGSSESGWGSSGFLGGLGKGAGGLIEGVGKGVGKGAEGMGKGAATLAERIGKGGKLKPIIQILNNKKAFIAGETVQLLATVKNKDYGRLYWKWYLPNKIKNPVGEEARIDIELSPQLFTKPEEKLQILVEVSDSENVGMTGIAQTTIIIRSPLPVLNLINPKSKSVINLQPNLKINAESKLEGLLPNDIDGVAWLITEGDIKNNINKRIARGIYIAEGEKTILDFTANPELKNLKEGVYTIITIIVAHSNQGKLKPWLSANKQPVFDYFYLNVKAEDKEELSEEREEAIFVEVLAPIGKNGKNKFIGFFTESSSDLIDKNKNKIEFLQTNQDYILKPATLPPKNINNYEIIWEVTKKLPGKVQGLNYIINSQITADYKGECIFKNKKDKGLFGKNKKDIKIKLKFLKPVTFQDEEVEKAEETPIKDRFFIQVFESIGKRKNLIGFFTETSNNIINRNGEEVKLKANTDYYLNPVTLPPKNINNYEIIWTLPKVYQFKIAQQDQNMWIKSTVAEKSKGICVFTKEKGKKQIKLNFDFL